MNEDFVSESHYMNISISVSLQSPCRTDRFIRRLRFQDSPCLRKHSVATSLAPEVEQSSWGLTLPSALLLIQHFLELEVSSFESHRGHFPTTDTASRGCLGTLQYGKYIHTDVCTNGLVPKRP